MAKVMTLEKEIEIMGLVKHLYRKKAQIERKIEKLEQKLKEIRAT